ncbi:AP-3 complex subunit delta [Grifola frondosa]|uniref:AP-3 complex subunit delta n=1 Tax=Grifola frondosa TaxID=5627 RepID=A0A1C7LWX7_GRIFR|nr:AP-3 complex subunit delta [Grifola frondosa]
MLVNTLRKDLENTDISRICLALDTIIQFSTEDVIPAIQSRLFDLLSHNSAHVRRRALLAFDRLSRHDPEILTPIVEKTRKRLTDSDSAVVSAALTVNATLVKAQYLSVEKCHGMISKLLKATWTHSNVQNHWLLIRVVETLQTVSPSMNDLRLLLGIIQAVARRGPPAYALLYQCFLAVTSSSLDSVLTAQAESGTSFIQEIRHFLTSKDPIEIYLFVSCLGCVDPKIWAGISPDIPAILEGWEVERVMKLLDSEDKLIRGKVDSDPLSVVHRRLISGDSPTTSSSQGSEGNLNRLLEVLDVLHGENGETYAYHLKNILRSTEGEAPLNKRPILQDAVEEILTRMRIADSTFRSGCIGALFASVADVGSDIGPTLMVILSALTCEYLVLSPISPIDLLRGFAGRLSSYSASIQDACILSMMRISIGCDEVPAEVTEVIKTVHEHGGRYIKRRCDQFTYFSRSRETLKDVISAAHSSSLPDFLAALEDYEAKEVKSASRSSSVQARSPPLKARSPEPSSSTSHKLRYEAYEAPKPVHKFRRLSNSSRQSDDGSSRFIGQDPLSRTVTPGDLALAAGRSDLRSIPSGSPRPAVSPFSVAQIMDEEDAASHVDLIALDSPFISEPPAIRSTAPRVMVEYDFESTWNKLETHQVRGWCDAPIDAVLRRLQDMQRRLIVIEADMPPFKGDLKVLISPEIPDLTSIVGLAALRLKEGDDESCLWRLRCEDDDLRTSIQALLKGMS